MTTTEFGKKQTDLQCVIKNASQHIVPVWPLETFIACNPLKGFESLPFEEALLEGKRLFGAVQVVPKLEIVNRELIKWCGVFLDIGQGTIEAPNRNKGFYKAFLGLAIYDNSLHQGYQEIKSWLSGLPENADDAIELCLDKLGVPLEQQESFIKENFAYLPGWAGYIKWRSAQENLALLPDQCPVTLMDFLAVRLVITVLLFPEACCKKKMTQKVVSVSHTLGEIKKEEKKYQDHLIKQLMPESNKIKYSEKRPDAQLVFCIDVRSEPFRRCIEGLGNYETFGFAGFFGVPVCLHDANHETTKDLCPVLLKPRHHIQEKPIAYPSTYLKKNNQGKYFFSLMKNAYYDLKYNFSTPFALVETLGVWCGIKMLVQTLAPVLTSRVYTCFRNWVMPVLSTQPIINVDTSISHFGISAVEQALYAETVLKMMGFTKNFAKRILFCGHGSSTQNNPYASALDCGACGGNHGGSSAKIFAAILNKKSVRKRLAKRGIIIPEDTFFYAAAHDTTTDKVTLYDDGLEYSHQAALSNLKHDLALARQMNSEARCKTFGLNGMSNASQITLKRSSDWAEVRPEWGLACNAAFIIGPRQLTKEIDLKGRCFLHSYDWEQDKNGDFLKTILTAPMIVAEWINTQYLFSTLDNVSYGSGSKITQNVTGRLGVMQGNGSDLMHGLPLQSVMSSDTELYHQPQRLLTVVYGSRRIIDAIIESQEILKTLFFNGWVRLLVIEPAEQIAYQLDRKGNWCSVLNGGS